MRTWLGCHRRAFELFSAVPARLIIDNAKCAITIAGMENSQVQRAHAEGDDFRIDSLLSHDQQKTSIVEASLTSSPPSRFARRVSGRAGIPAGLGRMAQPLDGFSLHRAA